MKYSIQRAHERGTADYGWLKPTYYFSFSSYYDPSKIRFGLLRVLNDDWIAGGGKFETHPHDNMEIVTIPLSGAVRHKDSTGAYGVIKAGDVQIMSAGSGVQHSEANDSHEDPLSLFQIWVYPKVRNITPRYDQRSFSVEDRKNKWQIVVSPREEDNALWINQDARFSLTDLEAGQSISYQNAFAGNGMYLVVIDGDVTVGGEKLNKRDAIGISETDNIDILADSNASLLLIEVPMN
jgi:redox-sensitive bicupin YhaK (pirin superfamily)